MSGGDDTHITETILDSIADGVFTVDRDWRITSINRAAGDIIGISREEATGRLCSEVFHSNICETDCGLRRSIETGRPVVNKPVYIVRADGERIPISISASVLRDKDGNVIGGVETFRDLTLVETLRRQLTSRYTFHDIISKNHEMRRMFDVLPGIAESDSTALIEGESGTGKELFARAIHELSRRKDQPLVVVNCGALPDTLLESELFGYVKGAFTGAVHDKPGRFALAHGGTIFLDEIGEITPALQVRLLRVLQEKTFEPLGAVKPARADVRVISASNRNIEELVREGNFRQDLFYRINVVKIAVPPLRRRKEDIPLLVDHFINRFNHIKGKDIAGISDEVSAILMRHDYPGNVRELENIIEHAFVMCRSALIQPGDLPAEIAGEDFREQRQVQAKSLDENEAVFIQTVLARNSWNVMATSRELDIHKSTLWRKIKKHGIMIPARGDRGA